jgi:hypothetical protein
MVRRGYLERDDEQRAGGYAAVRPTERGRAAERVVSDGAARVDAMLRERLGAGGFESFRAGLLVLAERRKAHGHLDDGDQVAERRT